MAMNSCVVTGTGTNIQRHVYADVTLSNCQYRNAHATYVRNYVFILSVKALLPRHSRQ